MSWEEETGIWRDDGTRPPLPEYPYPPGDRSPEAIAYRERQTRAELHNRRRLDRHRGRLGGDYTPADIERGHRQLAAEYRSDPAQAILDEPELERPTFPDLDPTLEDFGIVPTVAVPVGWRTHVHFTTEHLRQLAAKYAPLLDAMRAAARAAEAAALELARARATVADSNLGPAIPGAQRRKPSWHTQLCPTHAQPLRGGICVRCRR